MHWNLKRQIYESRTLYQVLNSHTVLNFNGGIVHGNLYNFCQAAVAINISNLLSVALICTVLYLREIYLLNICIAFFLNLVCFDLL